MLGSDVLELTALAFVCVAGGLTIAARQMLRVGALATELRTTVGPERKRRTARWTNMLAAGVSLIGIGAFGFGTWTASPGVAVKPVAPLENALWMVFGIAVGWFTAQMWRRLLLQLDEVFPSGVPIEDLPGDTLLCDWAPNPKPVIAAPFIAIGVGLLMPPLTAVLGESISLDLWAATGAAVVLWAASRLATRYRIRRCGIELRGFLGRPSASRFAQATEVLVRQSCVQRLLDSADIWMNDSDGKPLLVMRSVSDAEQKARQLRRLMDAPSC